MKKLFLLMLVTITAQARYYSQVGQDKYLHEFYFKNLHNGVFVDIGAHDGKWFSNSYFFEQEMGWYGICFEPVPRLFEHLRSIRTCTCIQACVAGSEGVMEFVDITGPDYLSGLKKFFDEEPERWDRVYMEMRNFSNGSFRIVNLPVVTFNKTMNEHGITYIDYLSIDTEGSEIDIIQSIDFDAIKIFAISIENNFGSTQAQDILQAKGFTFIAKFGGFDDLYINFNNARSGHKDA